MRTRVVLGAVAAAALTAQLPATASPQPDNGLWLVRADGSDAREVAPDVESEWDFAWSPDGAFLAYGTGDIWVLDLATGERTNVTDTFGNGSEYEPTWGPDGRRVAYVNGSDLWVRDVDGSDPVQLTEGAATDVHPSWAPAGNLISFERFGDFGTSPTLHVVDAGDGPSVALVEAAGPTSWSPDGREIVYRSPAGAVRVVDVATGAVDEIAAEGSFPVWEPGGDRIAYAAVDGVFVVSREGGPPTRVVDGPTGGRIAWSPDGRALAVGSGGELSVVDLITGETLPITDEDGTDEASSPMWSPAGDLVAYVGVTYGCCWFLRHDRSVVARDARHLAVRGEVRSPGFPQCADRVTLKVQRRRDGAWIKVRRAATGRAGRFGVPLPDRPGRYRVVAPRLELTVDDEHHVCRRAHVALRHRHSRSR